MEKRTGGTRNYSHRTRTLEKRRSEFESLVATGAYRLSAFDSSGGYYLIHNEHLDVDSPKTKEVFAATALAEHGYRAYLMPDNSYVEGFKKNDGFVDRAQMDIKTVNTAGNYTIKNALAKASMQGAEIAVIVQNTGAMTKEYVDSQLKVFRESSEGKNNKTLKAAWIISMDGKRIHRRPI